MKRQFQLPFTRRLDLCRIGLLLALLTGSFGCGQQTEPPPVVTRRPHLRRAGPALPKPDPQPADQADAVTAVQVEPTRSPVADAKDSKSELGRGLIYRNERVGNVPWSINLLKIDRARPDFELTTTFGRGRVLGLSALSDQVESLPAECGVPVAAVNGDFYRTEQESYAGDPRGLQIARGELVSAPVKKECSFWMDPAGNPHIASVVPDFKVTWPTGEVTPLGLNEERHSIDAILYTARIGSSTRTSGGRELILVRNGDNPWLPLKAGQTYQAEVREVREAGNARLSPEVLVLSIGPSLLSRVPRVKAGAVLEISTATTPDLTGVQVGLGGGPLLVHEGKVQSPYSNKAHERHPRSALGWNDKYFFFAEVDGRQYGFSVGMTLSELGSYLARNGCQEAMNLDGGGSAEMWIEGQVVNRPCFGYERSTANGLVVVRKERLAAQ